MGNCIGKKPIVHGKHISLPSTSTLISVHPKKVSSENQRSRKSVPPVILTKLTSTSYSVNRTLGVNGLFSFDLSQVKDVDRILNDEKANERQVIQYSSSLNSTDRTLSTTNESLFLHPAHSSSIATKTTTTTSDHKIFHSSNTLINSTIENHIKQSFEQSINTKDTTMGQFFSKENETNKENARNDEKDGDTVNSIDIKVHHHIDNHCIELNEQYLTIINDQQMSNTSTMVKTHERRQESLDTSPTSSLFDSSLSSLSCNTTPFSSQDRLILSSSPSSSSSVVLSPISSTTIVSPGQTTRSNKVQSQSISLHGSRSLTYAEQIYFHPSKSADLFTPVLPVSSSRNHSDPLINEFHLNIRSTPCRTLKTVIDNVLQQEFIRIHHSSQVVLIEHQQFDCARLKDVKKLHFPSLIFDDQERRVYLTKHARNLGLQSISCVTSEVTRLPKIFASCDHCSTLLSPWKLNQRLRPFFLVNLTHNLVEQCFNEMNNNTIFGYVSQQHPTKVRQTMINNSKLTYSYDLDTNQTTYYFVLRLRSWPDELRQTFENRPRFWPNEIDRLFDGTCFIRFDRIENENLSNKKCSTCEKSLNDSTNSFWSYCFSAMENELISLMSDEQIRFASILWNYFNAKSSGKFPFNIFKHSIFYFFEQFRSDVFLTSDLISHAQIFTDFLVDRLEKRNFRHYFNSNYNFYDENLHDELVRSLSVKMTYFDLKHFPINVLPKTSTFLFQLIYLIEFQDNFLQRLFSCASSKSDSIQTILDTDELVLKKLSTGIRMYKRQLETLTNVKRLRTLTIDRLYNFQEENVQIILDYLPLLRDKEPSLLIHSLWSMFIQYFNCLFDDLFISDEKIFSK